MSVRLGTVGLAACESGVTPEVGDSPTPKTVSVADVVFGPSLAPASSSGCVTLAVL